MSLTLYLVRPPPVPMWRQANIYDLLYRSEGRQARTLIFPLIHGERIMIKNPDLFRRLEPDDPKLNGSYEHALEFLAEFCALLTDHPDAIVRVSA